MEEVECCFHIYLFTPMKVMKPIIIEDGESNGSR